MGDEARSSTTAIKKLVSLVGAIVASDVIPFLEWLDLQGHLSSMKNVAKELDTIVGSWVEEHKGRLNSEAKNMQDFIDVMLTKLGDASMFGYSRETIIKATVLVCLFISNYLFWLYIMHMDGSFCLYVGSFF